MSEIIKGRIFHGPQYGDPPYAAPSEVTVPTHPDLVLTYAVSKVNGQWECDIQIHNHFSADDQIQAFKIIEESASKHAATPIPVAETVATEPGA